MRLLLLFSIVLNMLPAPLYAQGLGPVTADPLELDSPALLERLGALPEYPAHDAPLSEAEVSDLEEDEEYIYVSSGLAHAPAPVNLGGNGNLTLTRHDNGEKTTARYRRKDGSYDEAELRRLDRAMRCSLTGREISMSVKLIELLDAIEDRFGRRGLVLLSGYRTSRNNHRTRGAARESLHMLGWAADIRIPGYSSTKVKNYARRKRAGGVGYYPYKGFTHLDVGKARYWVMGRPPRRRRVRKPRAARPAQRKQVRTISRKPAPRKPAPRKS
ncbi:MAG: hypothetical protein CVU79_12400 [Elusimicrobia bacterium HGW-Elusimicrobia-3]|nr:MAG: hypothetical protein CVU79_12400 [Elusimicrobia bacterium HGW-Elusimicrobia-3]